MKKGTANTSNVRATAAAGTHAPKKRGQGATPAKETAQVQSLPLEDAINKSRRHLGGGEQASSKQVEGAGTSGKEVSTPKRTGRKPAAQQASSEVVVEQAAPKKTRAPRKAKDVQEQGAGGVTDSPDLGATTNEELPGDMTGGGDQGAAIETMDRTVPTNGDLSDDTAGDDRQDDAGGALRLGRKAILIEEMVVSGRGGRNVRAEDWPFGAMELSTLRDDGEVVGPSFFIPESEHPPQVVASGRKRHRGKPVFFITRAMRHVVAGQEDLGAQKGLRVWKVAHEVKAKMDEMSAARAG